jgi:hypothetical protein
MSDEQNCEGIDRAGAELYPVCHGERGDWPQAGWQLHLDLCYTLACSEERDRQEGHL